MWYYYYNIFFPIKFKVIWDVEHYHSWPSDEEQRQDQHHADERHPEHSIIMKHREVTWGERGKECMKDIGIAFRCHPEKKTVSSINCKFCFVFLPSGVKKIMDEMRKLKVSPETITQAITEPNRHHIITRPTPPTTPIRAVKASRTAGTDRGNMTLYRDVNMYHSS